MAPSPELGIVFWSQDLFEDIVVLFLEPVEEGVWEENFPINLLGANAAYVLHDDAHSVEGCIDAELPKSQSTQVPGSVLIGTLTMVAHAIHFETELCVGPVRNSTAHRLEGFSG